MVAICFFDIMMVLLPRGWQHAQRHLLLFLFVSCPVSHSSMARFNSSYGEQTCSLQWVCFPVSALQLIKWCIEYNRLKIQTNEKPTLCALLQNEKYIVKGIPGLNGYLWYNIFTVFWGVFWQIKIKQHFVYHNHFNAFLTCPFILLKIMSLVLVLSREYESIKCLFF